MQRRACEAWRASLRVAARSFAAIESAAFTGASGEKLLPLLDGEPRLSRQQVQAMLDQLKTPR